MEWRDEALIIGARKYGESSVILEAMTAAHGRHFGLVKGGRGARLRPLVQPGNSITVVWRARLEDHLGLYSVEGRELRAGRLMAEAGSLQGFNLMAALLRLLAEREPHPALYEAALIVAEHLDVNAIAAALLARFELAVLAELGFGLDLSCCAATGTREDLVFVSPKSGRAVSRAAGEPYRERLLPLPAFLRWASDPIADLVPVLVDADRPEAANGAAAIGYPEIRDAFSLAAYFLARDVFTPRGLALPDAHSAYLAVLAKAGL